MAKEKNDEMMVEIEAGKVDTVTGEVKEVAEKLETEKVAHYDFLNNDFEDENDDSDESSLGSSHGDGSVIYDIPASMHRTETGRKEDRIYYDYFVKYGLIMNGKKLEQTVFFKPSDEMGDVYDLLDLIYGDDKKVPFKILRTSQVSNNNGVRRTTYRYSACVSAEDDSRSLIMVTFKAAKGNSIKFENLLTKLKSAEYVR